MQITDIVNFWRGEQTADEDSHWAHRLDRPLLDAQPHGFNLDFPINPYVGNVLTARVIILSSNAGYDPVLTAAEFPDVAKFAASLFRTDNPELADWSLVSPYYNRTNYGRFIASGQAVLINASPYRSPMLTDEPANQLLLPILPTSVFVRRWLLKAVLPMAATSERLVVLKRGRRWWQLPGLDTLPGVIVEPNERFPSLGKARIAAIEEFLANQL